MLFCSTYVLGDIYTYSQPLQLNDKLQPIETSYGNSIALIVCPYLVFGSAWFSFLMVKNLKKEVGFEVKLW